MLVPRKRKLLARKYTRPERVQLLWLPPAWDVDHSTQFMEVIAVGDDAREEVEAATGSSFVEGTIVSCREYSGVPVPAVFGDLFVLDIQNVDAVVWIPPNNSGE